MTMRPPVRVAMVGVGRIVDLHFPAYQDFDGATLELLCDRDEELVRARARQWNVARWTTRFEDVLEDPTIDMVEINTPHHLHHPMVLAAARAGKHIQVQKPMAMTPSECLEMIATAEAEGVKLKVLENFVFYPPYQKARELLDSGEIGELLTMRIKLGGAGLGGWYVPLTSWAWRMAETEHGGGPTLFDDGYHKFSIAHYLAGPVEQVFAYIGRSLVFNDAPAIVTWTHRNGVLGCIDATFSPNLHCRSKYYSADERIELTGTKGVIWVTRCTAQLADEASVILHRNGVTTHFDNIATDWVESFKASTRHFVDCIRHDGEPFLTGKQALDVQRFCQAAIRSGREGRPVRPEEMTD